MTAKRKKMKDHPAYGCTRTQIKAFERVCIGDDSGLSGRNNKTNNKTADTLLDKGLIIRREERIGAGPFSCIVLRYDAEPRAQQAFFLWCGENVSDDMP